MQITTDVPDDRVPEFYQLLATFFAAQAAPAAPAPNGNTAYQFFKLLSPSARKIFKLLITVAPEHIDAEKIAEECDIRNGRSGVAGTFGWPAQHARGLGIEAPWCWQDTGFGTDYWVTEEQAAFLAPAFA
jgi:Family of unknown function (DUF6416)